MTERSLLITGAASGIGRDAARGMAARGWRVLATCRNPDDCAGLIAEGLESFPLDLASGESVAAAAAARVTWGRFRSVGSCVVSPSRGRPQAGRTRSATG